MGAIGAVSIRPIPCCPSAAAAATCLRLVQPAALGIDAFMLAEAMAPFDPKKANMYRTHFASIRTALQGGAWEDAWAHKAKMADVVGDMSDAQWLCTRGALLSVGGMTPESSWFLTTSVLNDRAMAAFPAFAEAVRALDELHCESAFGSRARKHSLAVVHMACEAFERGHAYVACRLLLACLYRLHLRWDHISISLSLSEESWLIEENGKGCCDLGKIQAALLTLYRSILPTCTSATPGQAYVEGEILLQTFRNDLVEAIDGVAGIDLLGASGFCDEEAALINIQRHYAGLRPRFPAKDVAAFHRDLQRHLTRIDHAQFSDGTALMDSYFSSIFSRNGALAPTGVAQGPRDNPSGAVAKLIAKANGFVATVLEGRVRAEVLRNLQGAEVAWREGRGASAWRSSIRRARQRASQDGADNLVDILNDLEAAMRATTQD